MADEVTYTYTIDISKIITTDSGTQMYTFEGPVTKTGSDESEVTYNNYRFKATEDTIESLVGVQWYGAIVVSSQGELVEGAAAHIEVFDPATGAATTFALEIADLAGEAEGDSVTITEVTP